MESIVFKLNNWAIVSAFTVVILLASGCAMPNHLPSITSLKAKQDMISPLSSCLIECVASDEDGDELSYEWTAGEGKILDVDGATIAWSAPKSEGVYNIRVKVTDGNGGEATGSVTITVKNNHAPTINGLKADADWVNPLDSCQIKCNAEDQDGDELSYEWLSSGGDISGTGGIVNWTAPAKVGLWNITVTVTDGYGGEDRRSLAVSVAQNPPPVIEDLIVTPKEPKYVKESSGGYMILKGKSCEIECVVASDNIGLSYEWVASGEKKTKGGQISGEGSVITWKAPGEGDTITITVTVSDIAGLKASKDVVFKVKTCACAFK